MSDGRKTDGRDSDFLPRVGRLTKTDGRKTDGMADALDAPKRYCLDLEGYAYITDLDAPVIVHSCKEGFFKDGTWLVDYPQPGQIYLPEYELCAAADTAQQDAEVVLQECSDAPLQHFITAPPASLHHFITRSESWRDS